LNDPESPTRADVLLCEATYGDREHATGSVTDELADIINRTAKRGGAVVIPAFAVDRTQLLMYYLRELLEQKRIPDLPVYVDSPMAINVTDLYARHHGDHDLRLQTSADPLNLAHVHLTRTVEDSKKINDVGIAVHHRFRQRHDYRRPRPASPCETFAGFPQRSSLVGYQAEGSGGRALQDGAQFLSYPWRAGCRSRAGG